MPSRISVFHPEAMKTYLGVTLGTCLVNCFRFGLFGC